MDIQLPQILFQIINFFVVLGAVTYLLYKPVLKILEERSKRIEEAQKAAQETLSERNRLSDLEADIKKKAEKKAVQVLATARDNAKKIEHDALADARKKAQAEIEKARGNWESERKQSVTEMKREFSKAVVATAEKVIGDQLTAAKHKKIIDAQLSELLKAL